MRRKPELEQFRVLVGAFALLPTAGCGSDGGRDVGPGGGVDSLGSTDGMGDDGIGTLGDDGDDGGDGTLGGGDDGAGDGDPVFDLGGAAEGTPPEPDDGCKRVDFLFVVDNSVSMENDQATLVGAFPGFMEAIQATLAADSDYHILVADTDEWGRCNTANPWNGHDPTSDTCNNYIKNTVFEECDRTRGAGVLHPAGQHATNMPCQLAGAHRYIEPGEPDLGAAFSCMATVGVAGHPSERPMEAIVNAISPELNAAGACNDGFLRDDALLVITFMSDDPNYEDTGTPDEWYQAVVDAKLGDPASVVVLGMTPAWPGCQEGSNGIKGEHWAEFIAKWGANGLHGNICGTSEEFVQFFQSAVSTIDQACDDYNPPG